MKARFYKIIGAAVILSSMMITACVKDLDTIPLDDDVVTSAKIYSDYSNYEKVLAKVYAGLAVSGQRGPDGNNDLSGLDEGFGQYTRAYFYAQELPTDECLIGWNDGNLRDYQEMDWSASNEFIFNMYSRIFYQISLANEFIRETSAGKLADRGFSATQVETIELYRAEARLLRAMSYYHALDMFGSVPFVTEEDAVGSFLPEQISRRDLFDYVESELLAVETELLAPRTNVYGRMDQATAWMLLARLYLNAEVYGAGAKYTEAITYTKKVIAAGYELETNYAKMFMADNHTAKGIIFAVPYDGNQTKAWGGTTFLVNAQVGGSMLPADFGISGGWWGLRARPQFVDKFPGDNSDKRKLFWTAGQSKEIDDMFNFNHGFAVMKWKNVKSTGGAGVNGTHPDTDQPLFRLADAYLMYAEAVLRGGTGGSTTDALNYVNAIRTAAYGNTDGNITQGQLTLSFILDERARELYWEGYRRTDLIRYGLFTGGTYIWQWKGGVKAGIATDAKYNLYPIPDADMGANPNLTQNDGY
ncbi:MAG: RagB/SusD family nutrient uptake outer membrane protein [Bacteroidales bacterium]|nr:RagB/SusD family nutrient uptake outer membrane protein [Bacteroidales bacterium]